MKKTKNKKKKNNHVSPSTSSPELQICGFLFDPARTLTPQFSFIATRLVSLLLSASRPKHKRFIREHQTLLSFKPCTPPLRQSDVNPLIFSIEDMPKHHPDYISSCIMLIPT